MALKSGRRTGARQYEQERHELDGTGPDIIPATGMDRLGSVEFRQWMAQQARILGDAMRDENEMVNRKLGNE